MTFKYQHPSASWLLLKLLFVLTFTAKLKIFFRGKTLYFAGVDHKQWTQCAITALYKYSLQDHCKTEFNCI